jgi:hypothetical protein
MTVPSTRNLLNPQMADGEVSPKVSWPALALLGIGVVLVVLHFILDDSDNTLLDIGLSAIGSSGLVGGLGYKAKVGRVQVPTATGGTTYGGPLTPGEQYPEV